jgi:hypothetical protein
MNKKDIAIEMKHSVAELRGWAERLMPASRALARELSDRADSIENSMAGRGYDSERALITMGKVEGLVTAAQVLYSEWERFQSGNG